MPLSIVGTSSVSLRTQLFVISGLSVNPSDKNYFKLERVPAGNGSIKLVVGLYYPEINSFGLGNTYYLEKPSVITLQNTFPIVGKVYFKGFSSVSLKVIQYRE